MALVESLTIPLGTIMPAFRLPDPDGRVYDSDELMGQKGLIVGFMCNHCPYAQAVWPRLVELAGEVRPWGVNTVAINPNIHPAYPEDSPENMKKLIAQLHIDFPYLVDESQDTARFFKAQCTPDLYLFDRNKRLFYHGRLDDNWQDPHAVQHRDLYEAVKAMTEGRPAPQPQHPAMGCSIKWRR